MPVAPRWYARLLLYSVPIWTLAYHIYSLLNVVRCQNSPQYTSLRYGSPEKKLAVDYADENRLLYSISSTLLFWNSDLDCCRTVNMVPDLNTNVNIQGSLSYLWPLFLSFCLSQFIETLSCSIQSTQPMSEAGMTIFEHSLAFAEAETMVSREVGLSLFGVSNALKASESEFPAGADVRPPSTLTRAMILRRLNVPSEVLLIALISALSHLSSSLSAVFGIRARYRLFFTSCWALLYMLAFVWSMCRILLDPDTEDINILRFPTVCIVGFIPHLLVLVGICACAGIYMLALLITAISPPPGIRLASSFNERIKFAYSNLQANIHLSASTPVNVDLRDDFYTALLKTGIIILTTASEAVYMKESIAIRANKQTWLEEKRAKEIVATMTKIRTAYDNQKDYLNPSDNWKNLAHLDQKIKNKTDSRHAVCGYARERKAKSTDASQSIPRLNEYESGVGLRQRRGMWRTTFEFAKAVLILGTKLVARGLLSIVNRLNLWVASAWLSDFADDLTHQRIILDNPSEHPGIINRPQTSALGTELDVGDKSREVLQDNSALSTSDEDSVSQTLYDWWKTGGWRSEADSSGEFEPSDTEDDATSIVTVATDTEDEDEMDDGSVTPTRLEDFRIGRAVSADPDTMLDTQHLAHLLDPKTVEQQEEARLLACHLKSKRTITRAQYNLAQLKEQSSILASSRYFSVEQIGVRPSSLPSENKQDILLESYILDRRQQTKRKSGNDDATEWMAGADGMGSGGPQCVICQQKPRTILIWPCGCLSLCDDCRLGLAARNYSNCVCCRSDVSAFSRLYVP